MLKPKHGVWMAALGALLVANPAIAQVCPVQVNDQLRRITQRSGGSQWGVLVETLAPESTLFLHSGRPVQTLYNDDGDRRFVPASNAKVLVTAAALQRFGPDHRIRTSVYQMGATDPNSPVILRVVGRGDPSLTDTQLLNLAQQIRQQGVTEIDWLIGDDSYFQGEQISPSWDVNDLQAGYGAPTNSLILNQNAIGVNLYPQAVGQPLRMEWENPIDASGWQVENYTRTVPRTESEYIWVGRDMNQPRMFIEGQLWAGAAPDLSAVAVINPGDRFLQRFQQILIGQGIRIGQTEVVQSSAPDLSLEIAAVESAPMQTLITEANRNSTNLYAEAILRQIAVVENGDRARLSALQAGSDAIAAVLAVMGVSSNSFRLADGSGLSRQNFVSPAAIVDTLQGMARSPHAQVYRDSLAIAGQNGTLQSRFQNTAVAGRMWGKTGTLRDAVSLSGYLAPPNYDPIVFSILVNDPNLSIGTVRQAIDEMVILLSQLQPC